MMDGEVAAPAALGIEKLEACMDSGNVLLLKIIALVKSGVSLSGAAALATDPAVDAAVVELYNDIKEAIAEAKDLSVEEGVQLAIKGAGYVAPVIAAIKA